MQKLTIFHLYPDAMNLYGDQGNITTLVRRMHERAIDVEVVDIKRGEKCDFKYADIVFMGGGQDRGQKAVAPDLARRGKEIKSEIDKGLVALTICGGFQLFGKYFKTRDGEMLEGISVFDAYTVGSDKRCIGNIVVDISNTFLSSIIPGTSPVIPASSSVIPGTSPVIPAEAGIQKPLKTLVGFENHSGLTYLEGSTKPLGKVILGYGNTGEKKYEGAVYKNAFGTYLHGPVLPKNPHFADHLILSALRRKYGNSATLKKTDDSIELSAHKAAIERARTAKTSHI